MKIIKASAVGLCPLANGKISVCVLRDGLGQKDFMFRASHVTVFATDMTVRVRNDYRIELKVVKRRKGGAF